MISKQIGIVPQSISDKGQRRFRSVVGVQTDCVLPEGRPSNGKSGEGLIVLVAAVIRLSQKTSSALEPDAAGLGFRGGANLCSPGGAGVSGAVLGNSSDIVVASSQSPEASRRTTASPAVAAICSDTLITNAPSAISIFNAKRPTPSTSPAVIASYSSRFSPFT